MRAVTSIRSVVTMSVGALLVVGLVGLGVHHRAAPGRARSLGPPATTPTQVRGGRPTAPQTVPPAAVPAAPAPAGPVSSPGGAGSGLDTGRAGPVPTSSAPMPYTGAPSMLVPASVLLALALAARRLAKRAA